MTKILSKCLFMPAILFFSGAAMLPTFAAPANAQGGEAASGAAPKKMPAIVATNLAAGLIAQRLSRASGIAVVAEGALSPRQLTFTSAGGSLDFVLGNLVAALPKGIVLRATFVPATDVLSSDISTAIDGNAVATLLRAQDAFQVKTLKPAETDTTEKPPVFVADQFELFGRKVTMAEATPEIVALHLRPVYILMFNRPAMDPVARMNAMQSEAMKQWLSMNADQRKEAAESQFSSLMNMDSADRMAMLGQMMDQGKYMMQMMQNLPPDQAREFMNELAQSAQQSGLIPKGGGGAPAPK